MPIGLILETPLADVPAAFPETLPPAPTGSGIDADRRLRFLREQLYITLRAYPYLPSDGFVERPEQVALWESRNPWPQLWDSVAVLEGFATAKQLIAATPRVEEIEGERRGVDTKSWAAHAGLEPALLAPAALLMEVAVSWFGMVVFTDRRPAGWEGGEFLTPEPLEHRAR